MGESSTLAAYAVANGALGTVVEQVNRELVRLQRAGAVIDPRTVRFVASANEFGTSYLGSFVYARPAEQAVQP